MDDGVGSVAISPDDRLIALGGAGETVHVLDAGTGRVVHELESEGDGGTLAFDSADRLAVGGSVFRLWDIQEPKQLWAAKGIFTFAISPDGSFLVGGERGGLYSVSTGTLLRYLLPASTDFHEYCRTWAFSPDGKHLACWSYDRVRVWRVERAGTP